MFFLVFYLLFPKSLLRNKIQSRLAGKADFLREILHSSISSIMLAITAILALSDKLRPYTLIYADIHDYPLIWVPVSLLLALVVHDTYFYWMHRILHHKKLFKLTHLVHHKSTNPSPWTSYSFHFLEAIAEGGVMIVLVFVMPLHPLTLGLFALSSFVINVYGHLGYEIMPKWFRKSFLFEIINTSIFHNFLERQRELRACRRWGKRSCHPPSRDEIDHRNQNNCGDGLGLSLFPWDDARRPQRCIRRLTGSRLMRPALEGMEAHLFDVDEIEQAVRLEQHLANLAERPQSPARNTVVVAGGGFTGIETATEMPARLRALLGDDAAIRVVVVDRGEEIAAVLGDGIRPAISDASRELGIEWCLGRMVIAVDADGVTLDDGQRIASNTVIWTVGFRASALTEQINAPRDNQGRLQVDSQLKVQGQPAIFAAGDTARAATDDVGNFSVMSCQHAIALGRHAGNNAAAELIGVAATHYSQPKYVTCLDLGAWGAVYSEGWDRQVKLIGSEAKTLKQQINSLWIYPPVADRAIALAAADPAIPVA